MATFQNTEQTYSSSGVSANWLAPNTAFSQARNSGGILNVAGPLIVKSILVVPASGQYTAASSSGVVLAVTHATSGMFAQLSGEQLFRYDGSSHSGLATGNLVATFAPLVAQDFLARSGLVTLNSGTHVYDIVVTYATKQF